ncbi:spindle assembly abnormal protein 7-like [Clytia hemisphaerica]|uniref:Uncharacterized protein n=1 Tax=Clytia hemisphaerica TaxID=252671 RepID=A0A7M5VFG5_9CNID|eukprot:TCONS_00000986-protein
MGNYERQEKLLERKHEELKQQVHEMRQESAAILNNISLTEHKIKLEKNYLNLKRSTNQIVGERFLDYKKSFTARLEHIKAKINLYVMDLTQEENFLKNRLDWRLDKKKVQEIVQLEDLRKKLQNVSLNLKEEIRYMQSFRLDNQDIEL